MTLFSLHSLIILPWTQLLYFSSLTTQRLHIAVLFFKKNILSNTTKSSPYCLAGTQDLALVYLSALLFLILPICKAYMHPPSKFAMDFYVDDFSHSILSARSAFLSFLYRIDVLLSFKVTLVSILSMTLLSQHPWSN